MKIHPNNFTRITNISRAVSECINLPDGTHRMDRELTEVKFVFDPNEPGNLIMQWQMGDAPTQEHRIEVPQKETDDAPEDQ